MAASSQISEALRDFAIEFSVDFDERGTGVSDPFHATPQGILKATQFVPNEHVLSGSLLNGKNPILFKGVGHKLSGKNPYVFPLLTAFSSSFSYDLEDKDPLAGSPMIGTDVALASVFQARNNARVAFVGSVDLFSDAYVFFS